MNNIPELTSEKVLKNKTNELIQKKHLLNNKTVQLKKLERMGSKQIARSI